MSSYHIEEVKNTGLYNTAKTLDVFKDGVDDRIGHLDMSVKGVYFFLDLSKGLRNAKKTYLESENIHDACIEVKGILLERGI